MHFSLFGSQRGVVGGSTRSGCEEGRVEGAGQQDMFVPIWRCYTRSQSLLLHHLNGQHGSWLHDTTTCHPALCQPFLRVHAQVIKISEEIKILSFLNYDYKSNFLFVSNKCYMCILLTCDWREDNRLRTSSSLLLKCIVCNSKLVYVVWTLKSMQKSL